MLPLFCYGTLMVPEIIQRVTGRAVIPGPSARLYGYGCYKIRRETFPGIRPAENQMTRGVLYPNLTQQDIGHLDRYEGQLYQRKRVTISTDTARVQAWCYLIKPEYFTELLDEPWCYQHFQDIHLSSYNCG